MLEKKAIAIDANGITVVPNISLNSEFSLALEDINGNGFAALNLSGNFLFKDDVHVLLNDYNIGLSAISEIQQASAQRFFVTNGAGSLHKAGVLDNFLFPIGFKEEHYSPVAVSSETPVGIRSMENIDHGVGVPTISNTWELVSASSEKSFRLIHQTHNENEQFDNQQAALKVYEASAQTHILQPVYSRLLKNSQYTRSSAGEMFVEGYQNTSELFTLTKVSASTQKSTITPIVYPTQNQLGTLYVDLPAEAMGQINIRIYRNNGELVQQSNHNLIKGQYHLSLNIVRLIPGNYLIALHMPNGTLFTKKFNRLP